MFAPSCGFAQLLCNPFIGWRVGHGSVEDTTGVQFNDDKDENRTKQQVVDGGEVTSPDVVSVVLEEVFQAWFLIGNDLSLSRYFWMVRLLTSIPSLSSSPRIRSAPHSRFSCAICLMSSMTS